MTPKRAAIFGSLMFVACASTGVTRLRAAPPKPNNCNLDIYTSQNEVKREHEVLCMIDATSGRTLGDDRTVRGALANARPEACRCGADAMVVMSSSTTTANAAGWGEGTVVVRGIRYIAAAPATPVAGSLRGPCLSDGSCQAGLICASDLCVALPPGAAGPAAQEASEQAAAPKNACQVSADCPDGQVCEPDPSGRRTCRPR